MTLRRGLGLAVLAAVLVAGVSFAVAVGARSDREPAPSARDSAVAGPGTRARFAVLRTAGSNQCGLLATALDRLARGGQLQGSCCSRMDYHRYREQVQGLRRYADVPEVPRDPYDIPVPLAKRLLSYEKTIKLTPEQENTFERAMKLEDGHGPCCCQCWRWDTFGAQAKYLIARRGFSAREIASVWTLEDGCGGAGHASAHGKS